MPSVKELLSKIESGDISYEEKLAALSQVEASLQELKAKKEERVKFNVQLIIDEIKKVKQDVQVQLDYARSIVPERGPKGDQGERGVDGAPGRNGVDGRNGRDGQDGKDGRDGVSVTGAKIDFDGSLIITLSTGREINVGEVVAADLAEKIRVTMSTNSTVAIQDEGSTITSGVRNINFTGAGVTATASGDSVTVDISGGGGGSPFTSPVEINVNSSSSALLINQIGAGNALLVEDSANPDSTPTVIDASGNLILGKTSRQAPIANKFEVHSTSSETSGSTPSVGLYNWSSSSSSASHISFLRYPSGTVGTTTTPNASGDVLGRLRFYTQNGSGLFYSGGISATTASDLVSINMFYTGGSHTFNGPITSGTWNGTAIDIAYGGTGATTRQAAMDALAGAVTSGQYLRGDGTDVVMSAIQAADVPTLNQNTTGTAANVTGIVAVANGGSGTATPSLVAGTNVTITGTWPNQTIAASGGGGSSTLTIDNKTSAYTVVAGDLAKVINCTSGTFTVSLTAAATLGAGFNVTIWNTSTTATDVITIDPNGAETIDGLATRILRRGEGMQIVCDGTNFQTGDKKTMRAYAENIAATNLAPVASGSVSIALGQGATASGTGSCALGGSSSTTGISTASGTGSLAIGGATAGANYSTAIGVNGASNLGSVTATGAGAMALGGSYASGLDSFAAAVGNNTSTYGANNTNSVVLGQNNRASSAGGYGTSIGGFSNISSANWAMALGGRSCNAGFDYSIALGYSGTPNVVGKMAYGHASGTGAGIGWGTLSLYIQTTNATPAVLVTTNSTTPTATNQVILPNNSAYAFMGTVVARRQASGGTESAAWKVEGLIRREGTAASTTLVASTVTAISNAPGWTLALTADTTNGGLAVTFTGAAATNIRAVATIQTSEVTYA